MKKVLGILALIFTQSAFGQNVIKPTYFLNDRVGFVNYMVAVNDPSSVETTSNNKQYTEANPFYEFSINSSISPFGVRYERLKNLLQLRAVQIYMDTVNFQSKIVQFKNKEGQPVHYAEETVYYYKGKQLNSQSVVEDSSLINVGYRYVAFVVPQDTTIQESMFLSLDVLPAFATLEANNAKILVNITGWDIIRTFHMNPFKYIKRRK